MSIIGADLRAAIVKSGFPIYVVAARVRIHPAVLGRILRERKYLKPGVAERVSRAIEELTAEGEETIRQRQARLAKQRAGS